MLISQLFRRCFVFAVVFIVVVVVVKVVVDIIVGLFIFQILSTTPKPNMNHKIITTTGIITTRRRSKVFILESPYFFLLYLKKFGFLGLILSGC